MDNQTQLVRRVESENSGTLAPSQVAAAAEQVRELMRLVLRDGEHYGAIPGCGNKPTLLKPGAEKIAQMAQLSPTVDPVIVDLDDKGHREYRVTVTLTHRPTGEVVGHGVGSCSTMERKYNRRPPADVWNTCLKMAKKRAFVDAVLTSTAASDFFTQDIEDMGPQSVSSGVVVSGPGKHTTTGTDDVPVSSSPDAEPPSEQDAAYGASLAMACGALKASGSKYADMASDKLRTIVEGTIDRKGWPRTVDGVGKFMTALDDNAKKAGA